MPEPRTFLHVNIPGQPQVLERARAGGVVWSAKSKRYVPRFYDPNTDDKQNFQRLLQAACPRLKPELTARMGIKLTVWTGKIGAANEDADNFLKFYMDALSPPKLPKGRKDEPKIDRRLRVIKFLTDSFAVWGNDNQVDEVYVRVWRGALQPRVQILVYELLPCPTTEPKPLSD